MHGSIGEFGHLSRLAQAPAGEVVRPRRRAPARGAPLVGIVRNPRSHRNKGRDSELADCANILVETPRSHAALRETLARFAARDIDYLAVDGGDGTVRDVLTCGAGVFGDAWPILVVLPKGKTNALAVDLGLPNVWSLGQAMEAIGRGRTIARRPLTVSREGTLAEQVQGFILGAGAGFTLSTQAGQQAHRWGAFNSFAVGLSILCGLLQTLFGGAGNLWRRGTPMRVTADAAPVARSRYGKADERFVVFASTLERFPLGISPFGAAHPGLKMALIDAPLRGMLALLPVIMAGWNPRFLARFGFHRIGANAIDLKIGDRFILDGEYFPAGHYRLREGPEVRFVVP